MRTIVILLFIAVLIVALRILLKSSPAKTAWFLRRLAAVVAIIVLLFLLLSGRLHPIFGLLAAAIPFAGRLLPYLRYVPVLRTLWRRYIAKGTAHNANPGNQQSSVKTEFVEMTLDHTSGQMDGRVLRGQFAGAALHTLTLTELIHLLTEVNVDQDSSALLQSYLDRRYPDWRDRAATMGADSHAPNPSVNNMTDEEAYEILGLDANASTADIIAAHRRLIHKIHPDVGGTSYLATKINLAKDYLLKASPKRS